MLGIHKINFLILIKIETIIFYFYELIFHYFSNKSINIFDLAKGFFFILS